MSAVAHIREPEHPLDPALVMAGLDRFPSGFALVESGRILYANSAFLKTLRQEAGQDLRGCYLTDLLPEETRYQDASEIEIGTPQLSRIEVVATDFKKDSRALRILNVRAVPLPLEDDIAKWKSLEAEAVGRSAPGIAHDFGNVLTGILLYADLLIEELAEDCFRRHAEAIRRTTMDGVNLVQRLMVSAEGGEISIEPSSINRVISEMTSLLTRMVGQNIEIQEQLEEPLGLVKMDFLQVHQIILNLVINAKDAMPAGGKIILASKKCRFKFSRGAKEIRKLIPAVEFSVSDTGMGMDNKTLARAFEPFFTTKGRSRGKGLGMSMVQSIVHQAGGEIEIESAVGKGTRVTIRLPRVDVPNPAVKS